MAHCTRAAISRPVAAMLGARQPCWETLTANTVQDIYHVRPRRAQMHELYVHLVSCRADGQQWPSRST